MFTRRTVLLHSVTGLFAASIWPAFAQLSGNDDELLAPLDSLPISDLGKKHPFGSHPASRDEIAKADATKLLRQMTGTQVSIDVLGQY